MEETLGKRRGKQGGEKVESFPSFRYDHEEKPI